MNNRKARSTRLGSAARVRTIEDAQREIQRLTDEVSRLSNFTQYNRSEEIGPKTPVGGIQVREGVLEDGSVGAVVYARTEKGLFKVSEGSGTITGGGGSGSTGYQSVVTDNADGTYDHDDGNGTTVTIDTRASSNPIADAGTHFAGTTVEAALQELGAITGSDELATHLGAFGGTLIADNQTIKAAIQVLETEAQNLKDSAYITYAGGTLGAGNVQAAILELYDDAANAQSTADTHISNPTAAHAATAISWASYKTIGIGTVQSAIQELKDELDLSGGTDDQTAAEVNCVAFTGWLNFGGTEEPTVQTVIQRIDDAFDAGLVTAVANGGLTVMETAESHPNPALYAVKMADGSANGDLKYFNGSSQWVNLARGTNGQVLKSTATTIEWGAPATGMTNWNIADDKSTPTSDDISEEDTLTIKGGDASANTNSSGNIRSVVSTGVVALEVALKGTATSGRGEGSPVTNQVFHSAQYGARMELGNEAYLLVYTSADAADGVSGAGVVEIYNNSTDGSGRDDGVLRLKSPEVWHDGMRQFFGDIPPDISGAGLEDYSFIQQAYTANTKRRVYMFEAECAGNTNEAGRVELTCNGIPMSDINLLANGIDATNPRYALVMISGLSTGDLVNGVYVNKYVMLKRTSGGVESRVLGEVSQEITPTADDYDIDPYPYLYSEIASNKWKLSLTSYQAADPPTPAAFGAGTAGQEFRISLKLEVIDLLGYTGA